MSKLSDSPDVKKVILTLNAMLRGELDLILGCRTLVSLRNTLDRYLIFFKCFVGVDSETDDMPLGEMRGLCSPEYLKQKDKEKVDFLLTESPKIISACRVLFKVLSDDEIRKQKGNLKGSTFHRDSHSVHQYLLLYA